MNVLYECDKEECDSRVFAEPGKVAGDKHLPCQMNLRGGVDNPDKCGLHQTEAWGGDVGVDVDAPKDMPTPESVRKEEEKDAKKSESSKPDSSRSVVGGKSSGR